MTFSTSATAPDTPTAKSLVIETVHSVTGRDFPITIADRRPGDPAICIAASDKAHQQLGWKPQQPNLTDIIAVAWTFHQAVTDDACH
ncbi:MAG TPA: hypothetical protein VE709_11925 [Pseudonocardiaceae bacterium]|nr:hypothetical protein [Pseudonocardiaceae bacterium]